MHRRTTAALGVVLAAAIAATGITAGQAATTTAAATQAATGIDQGPGPRFRVITDNDYSGDPDGLVQLAHLLLSPTVDVRAVVGSHLAPGDPFDPSDQTATNAAAKADQVIDLAGRSASLSAVAGSNAALKDRRTPDGSVGAQAIIDEAMRTDTDQPLFVLVGGGLTDLASAYLEEPRIASRLTAVWIGGPEYPGQATPPPGASAVEYNTAIDVNAARVVFDSPIRLWQVPRNAYRQTLASFPEMQARLAGTELGDYLYSALDGIRTLASSVGLNIGETYILGDNPLVLLSALQSSFEADPSSSAYETVRAPRMSADGQYVKNPRGRTIRVYTDLDTRLMMEDLYAKVSLAG
jgi:inosine-uridine nucleoside N-ribohydrolase